MLVLSAVADRSPNARAEAGSKPVSPAVRGRSDAERLEPDEHV
jgi:hypothetical protein